MFVLHLSLEVYKLNVMSLLNIAFHNVSGCKSSGGSQALFEIAHMQRKMGSFLICIPSPFTAMWQVHSPAEESALLRDGCVSLVKQLPPWYGMLVNKVRDVGVSLVKFFRRGAKAVGVSLGL